jgi:MFS family permease
MPTRRIPALRGLDRRPLAIPAYRRLWLASVVTAVGGSFALIAVPVQLYALTGSSATVGWSAAATFPMLALAALWTGARADRGDRRRLLLTAHAAAAVTALLLGGQAVADLRSVPVLLVLVGAQGLTFGAVTTLTATVLPRVVPPDLLAAASSLSSLVRYTGSVVGPVLAGTLLPLVGLGPLYLLDVIALLAVLWATFRLPPLPGRTPPAHRYRGPCAPSGPGKNSGNDVGTGDRRRMITDPVLRAVLGVDLAAMAFGLPTALFPELAAHPTGPISGAPALGLLYAAYPAGVLAAGLLSGTFTRTRRPGALMSAAALVWGLTVVLAGLAPDLRLTLVALGIGGAANLVLSTCRNAITQAYPEDGFRGRAQGRLTVVLFGGPQAATLLHGLAGSILGARPAICLGGLLTLTTVALITVHAPHLTATTIPTATGAATGVPAGKQASPGTSAGQ